MKLRILAACGLIAFLLGCGGGTSSITGPVLDIDGLDDVFIPRKGISFNAAVEKSLSALGTDIPAIRK